MTVRGFGRETIRRSLVVFTCLVLLVGGVPGVSAQTSAAAISGVILDPTGRPAFGFKVVLRDVGSDTQYTSGPTDVAGNYSVQVPVGGRYKIESVIANDGVTKLPVQDVPPVSVLTAGTTRMNVRFTSGATAEAQAAEGRPAKDERENKMVTKAKPPWYKRPGPIVGMVLGGVVILALAAGGGGGGGGGVVSQSTPSQ